MGPISHGEYFYVRPSDVQGERLWLVGQEWHHLQVVQRARTGHLFFAVDGQGHCYQCELVRAERERGEARIIAQSTEFGEPQLWVTVAAAPLRGERFDLLVEKCTELGVKRLVPVRTARTVSVASARVERWRRVALAAMKQCGRSVWPEVTEPLTFDEFVGQASQSALRVIPHEGTRALTLVDLLEKWQTSPGHEATVLVGPEGGFTDGEVEAAASKGFVPVSLGVRRLRAETAAIVAATLVLALLDRIREQT